MLKTRVIQFPNTSEVPTTVIALYYTLQLLLPGFVLCYLHVITIHSVICYYYEEESKPDMILYVLFSLIKNFATLTFKPFYFIFCVARHHLTGQGIMRVVAGFKSPLNTNKSLTVTNR